MTVITSTFDHRCSELAQEVATIQNYNRQWLEIQENAETEERRIEAINAIKTNNDLIGEKTFHLNEILQGRNPFAIQEVVPEPVTELLPDLNVLAKIYKVRYFNFPFEWALYRSSSISVTESEVMLQLSSRRFSTAEHGQVIIVKGQIASVDSDGVEVKIQTEAHEKYTVWATDQHAAAYLRYRLQAFLSDKAAQIANENRTFYDQTIEGNTTAWVTPLLITINVAVFVLMMTKGYGVFSPDVQLASDWGANDGSLTLNGEWWRVVTSMFLHFGVLHLLLNMNLLWISGPLIERIFGSTRFLFLYFYAGVIGAIVSLWYSPWKVGVGASGALFGLIGGMTAISLVPKLRPPISIANGLIGAGLFFVVINGAIGLSIPLIDNAAHFGGLLGGAICGIILASPSSSKNKNELNFALVIRVLIATFVVGVAAYFMLLKNDSIQQDLKTKQGANFYSKARKLFKDENYADSMTLFRRASELGDKNAPNLIGVMHARGLGVEVNQLKAADWYKVGANRGDPYAMMNLYTYYRSTKPEGVDLTEINNLLLAAAKKDHYSASVQLELKWFFWGANRCDGPEVSILQKAVDDGVNESNPAMLAHKGWILYYGRCVDKDAKAGLKLLHKAYDLGAGRAGAMLGDIYRKDGEDHLVDLPLAQKFFETGAEKGDPRAQFGLGVGYRDGLGIPKDITKARTWFKRAADQDFLPAEEALKQLE